MHANAETLASREAVDHMGVAATETADLVRTSYTTAIKGAQEYHAKLLEFASANTNAAFEFAHRLAEVKTPSEFVSLSSEHAQKQFERLAEQSKRFVALPQNVTAATVEPLKRSPVNQRH
jgi:phasin